MHILIFKNIPNTHINAKNTSHQRWCFGIEGLAEMNLRRIICADNGSKSSKIC